MGKKQLTTKKRRPGKFTQAIADEILEWLAKGETLSSYCRQPNKPSARTVRDWKTELPEFGAAYARAREDGGHVIAERMREVAASGSDKDVQHRRLQIDVDKWLLARWFPHDYGDRQTVEHQGGGSFQVVTDMEPLRRSRFGSDTDSENGNGSPTATPSDSAS